MAVAFVSIACVDKCCHIWSCGEATWWCYFYQTAEHCFCSAEFLFLARNDKGHRVRMSFVKPSSQKILNFKVQLLTQDQHVAIIVLLFGPYQIDLDLTIKLDQTVTVLYCGRFVLWIFLYIFWDFNQISLFGFGS